MPQTTIAPHMEELVRALGDKIGSEVKEADLEAEFARYLEYGVPVEQAKRSLLRQYGVVAGASSDRVALEDIEPDQSFVNVLARVVHVEPKTVQVRGEPKTITTGLLADETMSRSFTSWNPLDVAKGDTLRITGAYTKVFRGEPEIHLGDRVQIEKVDASLLPDDAAAARPYTLGDLKPGLRHVEVTARVVSIDTKEVTVEGQPKTVWEGILGDATGKVRFTAWDDLKIKADTVIKVGGAYVRGWRGTPQLVFDASMEVERVDAASFPALKEIDQAGPVAIGRFVAGGGGGLDVTVEGTIIEVRPGSGLITRCTDCRRVLREGACSIHGAMEGETDLRVKAIVDDGTGAINTIFGREITEGILGRDLEACRKEAKEAEAPDGVEDELRTKLTARPYRVRGNVLADSFGPMMIAQEAQMVQRDLAAAAEALLAEIAEAA